MVFVPVIAALCVDTTDCLSKSWLSICAKAKRRAMKISECVKVGVLLFFCECDYSSLFAARTPDLKYG